MVNDLKTDYYYRRHGSSRLDVVQGTSSRSSAVSLGRSSQGSDVRKGANGAVGAVPLSSNNHSQKAQAQLKATSLSSEHLKMADRRGSNISSLPFSDPTVKTVDSLYQRLQWQQIHDEEAKKEFALGKRIGFYRFKNEIGTGNFSKVKLAHHLLTKEKVAVKIIDKTKLDAKTRKMLNREIRTMDMLSHPALIRLYEVAETVSGIFLFMEYAPGGELYAKLSEDGCYNEDQARPIFAQIASAVSYMHDRFFIHRDIKAENVFFVDQYKVKLGDFGFATQVDKIDQHLNTFCGSPPYAAPELFEDDHYYGPSVDIWALGILLYFMVTGQMPFNGKTVPTIKHAILDGSFELPEYLSQECMDLISGILRRKPLLRLTLQQMQESPWLEGVEWPEEDSTYRPLPSTSYQFVSELSETEQTTRETLEHLGITKDLLQSHVDRGSRSHVIGTFRIIQHRTILNSMGSRNSFRELPPRTSQSDQTRGRTPPSKGSKGNSSESFPPRSFSRRRNTLKASKHSKFCNLL